MKNKIYNVFIWLAVIFYMLPLALSAYSYSNGSLSDDDASKAMYFAFWGFVLLVWLITSIMEKLKQKK